MTGFQRLIYDAMEPGVWYDVFQDQGTGGAVLPDLFYRNQTNPQATLVSAMVHDGHLNLRNVGTLRLPQVMRLDHPEKFQDRTGLDRLSRIL